MSKLPHSQRITAVETMLLSDDAAGVWLKDNAYSEAPSFDYEHRRLKDIASFSYARRKSPRLTLAVARFGTDRGTLRRLLRSGTKTERLAVLANALVGPLTSSVFRSDRFVLSGQEANAIVANRVSAPSEFAVLLSNPCLNREWITDLVAGEGASSDEDMLLHIVATLATNPMIAATHDDTYMDGYAEYSHDRLNLALVKLLDKVSVNVQWAHVFERVLSTLALPFVPDFETPLLERWQNPGPDPEGKRFDPFQHLRQVIVRTISLRDHRRDAKASLSIDHADKAVRLALYSALPPHQLFGGFVEADEFYYPDFKSLESSELTKEQKIVVDVSNACFERDGNDFIEQLMWNERFWRKRVHRDFINRLGWDLADDPNSRMDVPNLYRAREQYYIRAKPDWFADDELTDTPEADTIEGRIKKIGRNVDALKMKVDEIAERTIEPRLAALAAQLQGMAGTMRRQQILLVVLLALAIYLAVR